MARTDLNDIVAFLAVTRERSFTRAAAQLGVSQSALSQTIRAFEARLGLRLLTRTTRSVAPTEAGERLVRIAGPRLGEIAAELAALNELSAKPSGTIRISAHDHALRSLVWPALARLLPEYPDIKVEVVIDYGLTDIVAERYDAGIRSGELIDKDMIAVRIGPDLRSAVVGAPAYFENYGKPKKPQDLTDHSCVNLRLPTLGGLYAWEFAKAGREVLGGSIIAVDLPSSETNLASVNQAVVDFSVSAYLTLVEAASELGATWVTINSGRKHGLLPPPDDRLLGIYRKALERLATAAQQRGVRLLLENIPGMLLADAASAKAFLDQDDFGLTATAARWSQASRRSRRSCSTTTASAGGRC